MARDRESLRKLNIAQTEADGDDPQWAYEMRQIIRQPMGWDTPLQSITESSENPTEAHQQLGADHERLTHNYSVLRSQNIILRRHVEFLQRQLDDMRALPIKPTKQAENTTRTEIPRKKA